MFNNIIMSCLSKFLHSSSHIPFILYFLQMCHLILTKLSNLLNFDWKQSLGPRPYNFKHISIRKKDKKIISAISEKNRYESQQYFVSFGLRKRLNLGDFQIIRGQRDLKMSMPRKHTTRFFNVITTLLTSKQRRINVKKTSCAYWVGRDDPFWRSRSLKNTRKAIVGLYRSMWNTQVRFV